MKKLLALSVFTTSLLFAQSQTINKDWSLNGLGITDSPLNVSTVFADTSKVTTVWKYTPSGWQAMI